MGSEIVKEFQFSPVKTLVSQLPLAIGEDSHGPGYGEVLIALARQIDTLIERVDKLETKLMENDR